MTGTADAKSPLDPCEVLGQMNNSLEHLEQGYFNCFHETVKATQEVLADLNEVDATYVDTVLKAMGKWQKDITLTIADMHTDDCIVWDAKHNAIDEATQQFGETCEASRIKCANAREARQRAMAEGNEKDPVVKLLDRVLIKMREAVNIALEAFEKQFEQVLVPRVPTKHLPLLVSNAYNTVSQFRMTIWQMVADECIMPMWHNYLMNFGLATIMQHALEKVPSTSMRIVPPHPPEPKDSLTTFLDSLGNTSASHALVTPFMPPTMAPPVTSLPPAFRHRSSSWDSRFGEFGHGASAHDYYSSLRVSAPCSCTCWHGDRCISFSSFPCSTSGLQAAASKHPCRLHFLRSSCCIHTEGV